LRALRENGGVSFDHAWEQAIGPLPAWLQHSTSSRELAEKITAWIETPDWDTSIAYVHHNAADLLTDNAEAAIEHLIDVNPAADKLPEHLRLLKAARTHGIDAAYAALHEQLRTKHLLQTLEQWLAAPTWTTSRVFAADHGEELLDPSTQAILGNLSGQRFARRWIRLHHGLLAYAATAEFDAAYDLLVDTGRQRAMIADRTIPVGTRLAIARMHSGLAHDDPEAHFELAAVTLFSIPYQAAEEAAAPLVREAAAVLAECAANAAPYEQRDFARRLSQIGAEHPPLATYIAELQPILTGKPNAGYS
jgi:hypothetical protein